MRFPCRQFVGALAIILMALSSAAPLGYTHAHAATVCQEHEHGHAHGAAHTHEHVHCHHHCHGPADRSSQPAMLAPHAHQHVFWWGLELVIAAPPTDDSGRPTSDFDGTQLQSLRTQTSEVAVELTASPQLLSPVALVISPAPPAEVIAGRDVLRFECNLLCDAARHARTGVQLL